MSFSRLLDHGAGFLERVLLLFSMGIPLRRFECSFFPRGVI
jgi:hypothetical protein